VTAECPQTHINGAYGLLIEREGEGTMREELDALIGFLLILAALACLWLITIV